MADKREAEDEEFPKDDEESPPTDKIERPISGKSGRSTESKKSIPGAVTQLTAKALREFRLSDDGRVSESEGGAVGATEDLGGPAEGQTLIEQGEEYEVEQSEDDEKVEFIENRDIEEEEEVDDELESSGEEEDSDGENDLVVLDPDHVRK